MYKIENKVYEIVEKGLNKIPLDLDEVKYIFNLDPLSKEAYYVRWAGMKKSMEMADGLAEIHGQIGLDTGPSPRPAIAAPLPARMPTTVLWQRLLSRMCWTMPGSSRMTVPTCSC